MNTITSMVAALTITITCLPIPANATVDDDEAPIVNRIAPAYAQTGGGAAGTTHRHDAGRPDGCPECHQDSIPASHPVDFTPERELPAQFPLDRDGYFTCLSCHEIEGNDVALRADRTTLCFSCHASDFFAAMVDTGVSLSFSGHFSSDSSYISETMDPYSLQCASCHADEIDGEGSHGTSGRMANHTVGTDYLAAYDYGGYRDIEEVAESVFLPDNRISCVSCHKAYSSDHGVLVSVVEKRDLCYTCHDI